MNKRLFINTQCWECLNEPALSLQDPESYHNTRVPLRFTVLHLLHSSTLYTMQLGCQRLDRSQHFKCKGRKNQEAIRRVNIQERRPPLIQERFLDL
ncbi:hypothetical protein DPEC_G00009160 [Dallia pectoralis]|uniref:Uncharacterized protein n=1 Tax=Dallia pectoralis TaxID=75939 RepID=A0ACC2HL07_DALPE|nr:hypothetical protein DPEC_G00009160 [Dallia pectoralis]